MELDFFHLVTSGPIILIFASINASVSATKRPIIGVLTQETSPIIKKHFPNYSSYVSASYVKSLEASGARVVPIFVNQSRTYYQSVVDSINGLLLPGGRTWFNSSGGYADAAGMLFDMVKATNEKGDWFPVLAVCLGFEVLLYLDTGKNDCRINCDSRNVLLPLNFTEPIEQSVLYSNAEPNVIKILQSENVTFNDHIFCYTEETFNKCELNKRWKILSKNFDNSGLEFISSFESKLYPIAGLQFHPEKMFDWRKDLNHPHSPNAIRAMRYFHDWLVKQARRNDHEFPDLEKERDSLISNYPATFTKHKLIYDQLYLFDIPQGTF